MLPAFYMYTLELHNTANGSINSTIISVGADIHISSVRPHIRKWHSSLYWGGASWRYLNKRYKFKSLVKWINRSNFLPSYSSLGERNHEARMDQSRLSKLLLIHLILTDSLTIINLTDILRCILLKMIDYLRKWLVKSNTTH